MHNLEFKDLIKSKVINILETDESVFDNTLISKSKTTIKIFLNKTFNININDINLEISMAISLNKNSKIRIIIPTDGYHNPKYKLTMGLPRRLEQYIRLKCI